MITFTRRFSRTDDSGSALVAAVGVAVIGIALSVLVVGQAVMIMRDASRDRVRTIEIHAAEAALDATLKQLETETPCSGTMTVGQGPNAVDVTVDIQYYDGSGPVACDPDTQTLASLPTQAVITSDALPQVAAPAGVTAQRKIQTTVNLVPQMAQAKGAAIFAGGGLGASNNGLVEPLDPEEAAQVWIENQNWQCSNNYTVDGDVIVPDGSINMANSCHVTGDVWALSGHTSTNSAAIDGDLVVYNGDLGAWNNPYFGGNVSVGGNISDTWTWENGSITVVGTVCSDNVGSSCGSLPEYTHRGLPEVDYKPSDWSGFVQKDLADWADDVVSGAGLSGSKETTYRSQPCHMDNQIKNPIELPSANTIYDLRDCNPWATSNGITLVVNADIAIFAASFNSSNSLLVKSGDGAPHQVWFIVPEGGTADNGIEECTSRGSYTPGTVQFSNQTSILSPIEMFVYTPCDANISNNSAMIGQIYAKHINTSNNFHLQYSGMGIPGVDLGGATTSVPDGFSVEILNKHEIHND